MNKNSNIVIGIFAVTFILLLTSPAYCSANPEKYSLSGLKIAPPTQTDLAVTLDFTFSHQKDSSKENQSSFLEKNQVQIFEEGKSREINGELKRTDRVIKGKSIVMALDHSVSMAGNKLTKVKESLESFIDKQKNLSPLAVVGFNKNDQTLISDFGSDSKKIKDGISELSAYGKTSLYDTVFYATSMLEKREGANYLIFVTDGEDTSSTRTLDATIEQAKDSNLTVYTFILDGVSQNETERGVKRLSIETGGNLIAGLDTDRLKDFFEDLSPIISERYSLKYNAIDSNSNCERTVKVEINKDDKTLSQSSMYNFPDVSSPNIEIDEETIPEVTNNSTIKVPFTFTDNCSLEDAVIQEEIYSLDVRKDNGVAAKTVSETIELHEGNNDDINVSVEDMCGNNGTIKLPSIFYDSIKPEITGKSLNTEPPSVDESNKLYSSKKEVELELTLQDNYKLARAEVVLPDGKEEFDLDEDKEDAVIVPLNLQEKYTDIDVTIEDLAGNTFMYTPKLIFDPTPPELDIGTKPDLKTCNGKPITNEPQVPLKISVQDSNLHSVKLENQNLDCVKENDKYTCDTVSDINSGDNKKSVTAKDKAGNESTEYHNLIYDKQNPSVELAGEFSPSTAKPEIVIPLKFNDDWCLNKVVIQNDKLDLNKTVNLEGEEQGIEPKISLEDLEKQITQQDGVSEIEAEIQFKLEDKAGNIVDVDECDACTQIVKYSAGIINKDTGETYSDIHEAVNSANPGNTIHIGEMDVTGNIEIKKELTLTGLGSDKTTLESAKMGVPVLEIKGVPSGVTIKNLRIKSKRSECFNSQKDICPYVISVKGKSKVNITNSVLSNSSMAAVKVSDESQVEVSSSELIGSKYGLVAAESSKTSLTDTTKINNNTSHGIVIRNNSLAKINDCLISDNSGAGIRIESPEEQTVRGSNIKENGYGVIVPSNGDLLLKGNEVCTNDQHDLATFSKECGFDQGTEEFSGKIRSQNNSICSVCPNFLLED